MGGGAYKIETFLTPLHTVAKETKHMDASFIENGNLASASALASVMLVVALVVIVALDIVQRRVSRRG